MRTLLATLLLFAVGCSQAAKNTDAEFAAADPHLWLEEVQGEKALAWVKERNADSEKVLSALPAYRRNEAEAKTIILAKDRLPWIIEMGPYVYNFWQDDKHVRGLWRRTTLEDYKKPSPKWETVLDVDKLAKAEKENWVWKRSMCLPPKYARCLITLSRGGKDASVVREFDLEQRQFINGGFALAEAKSTVAWIDENQLLVGTDFGPGSMTTSGYPRTVRLWKRGQPLGNAPVLYEGKPEDVSVQAFTIHTPDGHRAYIYRGITFYTREVFEVSADGKLNKVAMPLDADLMAWIHGQTVIQLKSDWKTAGKTFKTGDVLALPLAPKTEPLLVFSPTATQSVMDVSQARGALLITYLDNIQGKIARARLENDKWALEDLAFPPKGELSVRSASPFSDLILVGFEGYLTPPSVLAANVSPAITAAEVKSELLKQLPARFDASKFKVEQYWTTSKDGTKVPYFFIGPKEIKHDGSNPVLIYGYGGFEVSETPYYLGLVGKSWLEKGGSYVAANIRGGGEFGPKWHQAALKENRQRAYDDFIAVAEDLVQRKISSPAKLAISGGSNGGLLVGATFVQRPDLYGAVICRVPLLDMLRYNKLLAGASWEGEYGKPEDAKMRAAILKYSPYQNVKAGVKYPEVFFITSTLDDRVHPGHARKMVARMLEQGHKPLYFENTEGGHSAAANLLQRVKFAALEYTFLQSRLLVTPFP